MSKQNPSTDKRGESRLKMLLFCLILPCMLAALSPAAMAAIGDPTVTITGYQVTPTVLLPGEQGMISVVLQNTATMASSTETSVDSGHTGSTTTSQTTDISVVFDAVSMFGNGLEVIQGTYDHAGALGPGQSMQFTFLIKAPAKSGMYFPEVWIHIPDGSNIRYPVPVNVNSTIGIPRQPILILSSVVPDSVQPGDEIPVTLTVRNDGQILADDVTVRIGNGSSTIAPRNTDLYHLGTINGDEQKSFDLVLISDKKTGSGLIRIPVILQYMGVDGVPYIRNTTIDIPFQGQAELGFVSVDTSPRRVAEGQPFDLTIRIENTGTGEAKQVAATIDLPMTGTREAFIGKIKPGNDAPAIFMLDGSAGGTYTYNVTIEYTDDTGSHTLTRPLSIRVLPSEGLGMVLPLGVVFLIGGFIGYRYWYLPRKNGSGALPWLKKS
ncbi:MAG: S-layer protein [Methanomicrobiales archaeon]|nr:S-layer protein [Methanomicrobiales archaeon]